MIVLALVVVGADSYFKLGVDRFPSIDIPTVFTRITLPGALFLALISVLPDFLIQWFNVPFYFGGTSLLIVVGVALDTVRQMESHLLMRNYEGFLKKSRTRPASAFGRRT